MDDIYYHIFSFLSPKEIATCMSCSKSFHKLGYSHHIWKQFKDTYSKTFYNTNFYETYKICFQLVDKLKLRNTFDELINSQTLYLDHRQITHIPKEIAQLTNLRMLALGTNQITHIPKEIAQLVNLRQLFVNNNQITRIPKEIAQFN